MARLANRQLQSPLDITGSLYGTASYASSAAPSFHIISGSIEAKVDVNLNSIFLIKSGSTDYVNIASNGDTTFYNNQFIIKNLITQQPVLSISQSIIQFATHSSNPQDPTVAGTIWFTSSSLYLGLE